MLLGVLAWQRVAGRGRSAWGPLPTFTVLVGTSLASLYGTLPASAWFYALLQHAVVIDLPWKCLSVTVFCAAALLAVAVDRLRGQPALRYGVVAVVQAKVASYPGWRAFVDGQPATLADRAGRVAVAVPRGDHVVSLVWRETGWRLVGDWASLLGLVYVGATAVSAARRSRP